MLQLELNAIYNRTEAVLRRRKILQELLDSFFSDQPLLSEVMDLFNRSKKKEGKPSVFSSLKTEDSSLLVNHSTDIDWNLGKDELVAGTRTAAADFYVSLYVGFAGPSV